MTGMLKSAGSGVSTNYCTAASHRRHTSDGCSAVWRCAQVKCKISISRRRQLTKSGDSSPVSGAQTETSLNLHSVSEGRETGTGLYKSSRVR